MRDYVELWKVAFRVGVGPAFTDAELLALRAGLRCRDERIIQGSVCEPYHPATLWPHKCQAACAIGYAGWRGGLILSSDVVDRFHEIIDISNVALSDDCGTLDVFVGWFDSTDREQAMSELLAEVEREVARRGIDELAVNSPTIFTAVEAQTCSS